ncbi:MAG: protease pro-enzyme activation domain-containing protein [Ktedonobacteraceae bacterium]
MQPKFVYRLAVVMAMLVVACASVISIRLMAQAKQDRPFVLQGQYVPLTAHAQLLGAASGQQQLNLSIGLQLRNQQELDTLLSDMYNPRSSMYHHFLTPQEFNDEFGPTVEQQQQVANYLHSQGLTIQSISPNGLLIDASATVSQAEAAFRVAINNYHLGANTFYANATAPTIPSALSSLIASIGGLDNSVRMHPLLRRMSPQVNKSGKLGSGTQLAHSMPEATVSGFGPPDLTGAYDAATLQQAGDAGNNQTVAVFELDGYQSSDITQYLQNYNLSSPSISNVLVDGYNGAAGAGAIEVELDIEVVAAMAPKANQVVYEGPNSTQGVNDTYNKIVTDNKAQVMTVSWGECETASGASELQTLDSIFKQGAAQGISMYAAAGDSGAYDCNDTNLAVDSPASDPYITGVGGTNLQLNGGAYGSESVWSNPTDTQNSPEGSGGGGGISNTFALPTWQTGSGVSNQYSNGNREVPDVSADADPATGYAVYCTVSAAGCPSSGWIEVGGTSAAAPLWAGSTATINSYLQQQGKSRVGFANPVIYGLNNAQQQYAPFHDVTSGTNLYYPATTGYDDASGWGSPDVYNIARDIAGGSTPPPTPTPGPTNTPVPDPTPTNTPIPVPTDTPTPAPTITPVPPPTITPNPPPPTGSLIQNGGFENGAYAWQESSAGGYEIVDSTNPHSGQYSAYLCGYSSCADTISQDFTVPAGVNTVTITYWWDGDTSRTSHSCTDALNVTLLDSNGGVIGKVQRVCNTDAAQQWQQVTFDATSILAQYAGQTVTLSFVGTTSSSYSVTTAFYVDDVAVNAG